MTLKAKAAYEEALRRIEACRRQEQKGATLSLDNLGLTKVPPEIGQLSELRQLNLNNNQLSSLPAEIGQLAELTMLQLGGNRFENVPPIIGLLSALETLHLHNNQLSSLPPEIKLLAALRDIGLGDNSFKKIPEEICGLVTLQRCAFDSNSLESLPSEFRRLNALKVLLLGHNQFECIPKVIGQLTALRELQINDNQLRSLPPEIGQLTALRELQIYLNKLSSLPPKFGQLFALRELNLNDNLLTSLPPEIGQLWALNNLALTGNKLKTLPTEIGGLSNLTNLYIGNNNITSLPPEVGRLSELKVLNVSDSDFEAFAEHLKPCRKLEKIAIQRSQLTILPEWFKELGHLAHLLLSGNEALGIPAEILGEEDYGWGEANAKRILDYYFGRQKGSRPLNEVKMLLVGRGEAGKSSISRALRGETFHKDQKETPGIEIQPWVLDCPGSERVKVHVWDFAGQEITHETHRFFLTERSLYVVVLDGRGGQQMEEAEYWLGHVERYGSRRDGEKTEHSPVIVVLNKWRSPGPYEVEKRRLQREHPGIRAFVETDCQEGFGIDTLRETICNVLEQMPAVRQPWPLTYFHVRQRLEALAASEDATQRRHFLKWEDYRQVCVDCGVAEQDAQTSLAENLNALGLMLYYGDDKRLRDTRVLNPNWAANGLYGLVRGVNRKPYKNKPGHLWQGEFPAVLEEGMKGMNKERGATIEDYPEERDGVPVHEFLLELMQDRELGFQAGEYKNQPVHLLPGLLTLDEPEPQAYDVAAHIEQAKVRFRYLYELLPAGVMSRFIVRTHSLSEDYFRWKRGVVLGWGDSRALVMEERRRNPRVDVFITGGMEEERQALAGVVRTNMAEIHRGLPQGLRGEEELELTVPGKQYEPVEKLVQLEAQKLPVQVVMPTGALDVPVTPELEQVQPATARSGEAPKLRVFVSYAVKNHKGWNRLKPYLDVLENEGLLLWWYDGKIRPGSEWDDAIRHEMKEADIILLLMSTFFFASKYIHGVELAEAHRRRKAGEADILPVLLEPTGAFARHSWLGKLQAVPKLGGELRPISSFTPAVNGWQHVEIALRGMIAEVAAKRGGR